MADNVVPARDSGRLIKKIVNKLGHRNVTDMFKRVWVSTGATPAIDAGSQATYPAQAGDFGYRSDNSTAFICTVAPAAATAATFTAIQA
jgi:hypothetical protein